MIRAGPRDKAAAELAMERRRQSVHGRTGRGGGRFALAILVCALSAAAMQAQAMPADAQNPANTESVAIGRQAAQTYCAKCHAIGRSGRSPNKAAPPLQRVAHKYRDRSISSSLIIDGTVVEHRGMPRFEVSIEEADGLIAFIRSLDRRR